MNVLLPSLLFVGSLVVLAIALCRGVDEWLANVRPVRPYRAGSKRCWRCGRELELGQGRCRRCRASWRALELGVASDHRQWAMLPGIVERSYVHHTVRDQEGRDARFVTPGNITLRANDQVRFVCDGGGNLRAIENLTLSTGWRLPTRAVGQRSLVAALGGLIAGPALLALLVFLPFFFLFVAVEHLEAIVRIASGAEGGRSETGSDILAPTIIWAAAVLLGGGLLGLRSRPRINRGFLPDSEGPFDRVNVAAGARTRRDEAAGDPRSK